MDSRFSQLVYTIRYYQFVSPFVFEKALFLILMWFSSSFSVPPTFSNSCQKKKKVANQEKK